MESDSAKSTLTGIKDLDLKIMMELSDRDLINYCKTDRFARRICKDENFWRNRFVNKFGEKDRLGKPYIKNGDKSWKDFYLQIIKVIDLDDINEVNEWGEYQYYDFYKYILEKSLGNWDVFDFLTQYFAKIYTPFYMNDVSKRLVEREIELKGNKYYKQLLSDLLNRKISTYRILRKVLDDSPLEVIEEIKNNIGEINDEMDDYLLLPEVQQYIGQIEANMD